MKLLDYFKHKFMNQPDGFTLRLTLVGGTQMNVAIYEACDDGLVTVAETEDERRFIPLSSIVFFDVEW